MSAHKSKLLIVEDEPATRSTLAQIFTGMGHEVSSAEDGFAGLERIREQMPDIILSDLNMPGMSGFEFLSVVRRKLPGIYVIATSGAYSGPEVPDGIAADVFYQKATGLKSLLEMMTAADKTERSGARMGLKPAPIWVAHDSAKAQDASYAAISCSECMRVNAYAVASREQVVHTESCNYCGLPIHYAVVR